MTVRGKRSQTRHVPSRPATFRSSGYRLLVESLEARGMLSATVGSPVEPIDSDFDAEPATVAVDQGEESVALASDVSLFVCPEFESTGDDASQLALDEAIDPVWEFDTWTGWIDDGEIGRAHV